MVDMMATRRVAVLVDVGSGVTVWLARVSDGQTLLPVGGTVRTVAELPYISCLSTALNVYPANKLYM